VHGADSPQEATTDSNGIATFTWDKNESANVHINEADRLDYVLASVHCTDGLETVGTLNSSGMHVSIPANGVVTCTFDNHKLTALAVTKTAATQAHERDTVDYTFTVTNTGDVALVDVTLTDDKLGVVGHAGTLASGASATFTKSMLVPTGQTADIVNTVTACGAMDTSATEHGDVHADRRDDVPAPDPVCATASHRLDVLHPEIDLDKRATPVSVATGSTVTYTYVVTNTGDTPLTNVHVDDDVLGAIGTVDTLAPDASATLTKSVVVTGSSATHNVGTVAGTDPLGAVVRASDDADITIVEGSTVTNPSPNPPSPDSPEPTTTTVNVLGLQLARTGSATVWEALVGFAFLLVGCALAFGFGRNRHATRPAPSTNATE